MHDMREWKGTIPVFCVSNVHGMQALVPSRGQDSGFASHNSTTNPLTAAALIYAFGAGITAGAGTRLVLQLILDIGWH